MPRPAFSTLRARFLLPVSFIALWAAVAPARAQLTEIQPGARVRIAAPGIVAGRYVGTVLTRSADTVELGAPGTSPIKVPIARITSVEVSRGSSRMCNGCERSWRRWSEEEGALADQKV